MSGGRKRTWKQQARHALRDGARWTQDLPGPAPELVRGAFRALPESTPGKARVRRILADPAPAPAAASKREAPSGSARGLERASDLLAVDPAWIGATYEPEDVLPMLAVENEILRRRLTEALGRAEAAEAAARQDAPALEAEEPGAPERVDEDGEPLPSAAELAQAYLDGQPDPGDAPRHLVVANDYPDVGREYGNGFVHRRLKHYTAAGVHVDVVLAAPSLPPRIYEYDGVRVLSGHGPEISEVLARQDYHSISVHFLNALMWEHLRAHAADTPVHVFLHGYECDRWIRRVFNFASGTELERAVDRTLRLQRFWQAVTRDPAQPASYIFVSDWWRRAVTDDMGVVFPATRSQIIHNFIDTDLFRYVPKPADQRFRILWVRSAASRKYGNDLAIQALQRLAEGRHWKDVEVTVIGDGTYFHEFEEALGHHGNVRIERRFVSQEEVAALHRSHGLLLVPSRLDSQGVSRDEAMSSGLVPVTNLVTAIPEFVDEGCAVVAGPEDADILARGMERVMDDPQLFAELSRAATERAFRQCSAAPTVLRELEVMGLSADGRKEEETDA